MAVKPVISVITPWDATAGKEINFSYTGSLPVSNRAIIYNASTMEIVYNKVKSGTTSHYIEPFELVANPLDENGNGNKYCIQISLIYANGTSSSVSDKVYFWCLATPNFYFETPEDDTMLNTSSVTFTINYSQANGEKLYNYRYYLYDSAKTIVTTSDLLYDETTFTYTFKSLGNKSTYYIRAMGVTRNGINVDTGMLRVYTNYYQSEEFDILTLESDLNATVNGTTNMICIEANEDAEDYIFIDSTVQLIEKKVTYEHNYSIPGDFTMQLKFTKLWYNGVIIRMYNKTFPTNVITIDQYRFEDGIRYCLKAFNGIAYYVLYTDPLEADNDDYVVLNLRRIDNKFSLDVLLVE